MAATRLLIIDDHDTVREALKARLQAVGGVEVVGCTDCWKTGLREAVRLKPDFWHMLLYPGQAPIPQQSSIEEINVKLPPQTVSMFGWDINWLVFFFIASLVAGYSLKGVFKVEV